MSHDRTYWRSASDARLIDEARDSGHELCIALGERLEDAVAPPESKLQSPEMLRAIIDNLRAELAYSESTINHLSDDLTTAEAEIERLRGLADQ